MSDLSNLIEQFLTENGAPLTKGSQRVFNNADLVANLADAVRDDARMHPHNFPSGSNRSFQRAPDEDVARWFLEQLDKIEKEGYEGTVYSRDGVNSDWIVRRYIAGSHNWEDIIGTLNMNLRDFYLLKNRGLLDAGHTDIPKFSSIRDIGKYLVTHYNEKVSQARDAAKQAALNKLGKSAKLVDNDDYKIYTVFNWAGARALGLGSTWCTANSQSNYNYNHYSNRAMLFQLFPKNPEQVDKSGSVVKQRVKGPEKYQFDAGTPCFHDLADDPADKKYITQKFPYIYTDLVAALQANKAQLEDAMEKLADDPSLNKEEAGKIKKYDIDAEIEKLKNLARLGYFTDKKRPTAKPDQEPQGSESLPPPEKPDQTVMEWLERFNLR